MGKRKIKNTKELMAALKKIHEDKSSLMEHKVFALALAYLIGELCPADRATKHVFRKEKLPDV